MGVSMVSSSENDKRHICASVVSGVPSTIEKVQGPREGNPSPSTTDFGITVTAAPVSTFASIVRCTPVNGFSRLIYTYTCSYGALNFNRSMVPVLSSTLNNPWLGQTSWPSADEIDIPKVWDDTLSFVHDCISIRVFLDVRRRRTAASLFMVRELTLTFSSPKRAHCLMMMQQLLDDDAAIAQS